MGRGLVYEHPVYIRGISTRVYEWFCTCDAGLRARTLRPERDVLRTGTQFNNQRPRCHSDLAFAEVDYPEGLLLCLTYKYGTYRRELSVLREHTPKYRTRFA